MNGIKNELKEAENYMLDIDENIVKITLKNVARVEAMIKNDSAYLRSGDNKFEPQVSKNGKINYQGSSAYWIAQLKEIFIYGRQLSNDNYTYEKCIKESIFAIDRENSTHLNADRVGRKEIFNRIIQIEKKELIELLKYPVKDDYKLIKIISEKTSKGRKNFSFATKFCHYMCFYLFEGEEEQDNFSIYDEVLANAIPKYCKRFKINRDDLQFKENYKKYIEVIDEIRNKAYEEYGYLVSRNGFDHLIWYFHKGRS